MKSEDAMRLIENVRGELSGDTDADIAALGAVMCETAVANGTELSLLMSMLLAQYKSTLESAKSALAARRERTS